mgnify:CR=1 FL=1
MTDQNKTCYPKAIAIINGNDKYPKISGTVQFYQCNNGTLVTARIFNLPNSTEKCNNNIFAFHIHQGKSCTGNENDSFADTKAHYNPNNCPHPYHSGDLPPLFGNNGHAYMSVLTDRFNVDEIIGRTVVIHLMLDDFKTQPSGNSGEKIACGVIKYI